MFVKLWPVRRLPIINIQAPSCRLSV
jgi:hypothetical protein